MGDVFNTYFTEAEEKSLFRTIKAVDCIFAKRDYYWMLLMRETAVRLGVLAGPDPKKAQKYDISLMGMTIGDAETSIYEGYLVYATENAKRQKKHPVALNKSSTQALKELLKINREMEGAWALDTPRVERTLFISRNRQRMSRRSFQSRFQMWCKKADVPIGTPHWLRHTWAKRFLERTTSPDALRRVQAVLGHSNISTTSIYTQPDKGSLETAMREASSCLK